MADAVAPTDDRFLTFKSEGRSYAVPAVLIAEVIRMPPVARVPHAPQSLLGLANLRGSVLPVASVRALLGRGEIDRTSSSRLIVLDGASRVALAVDEVAALVKVDRAEIKTAEADAAAEGGERLKGVFQHDKSVTKILDIPELLKRAFAKVTPLGKSIAAADRPNQRSELEQVRQRLVTFDVAGQEYALPLKDVLEVVTVPESLTFIPGSDSAVRGVMPYRDGLLPLLSLRVLLGLPGATLQREKVVVVAVGDVLIGLVTDKSRAVLSVDPALIEPTPPVLGARAGGETQIKEMYRAGQGRLVSILAPERLLREEVMQKLTQGAAVAKSDASDQAGQGEKDLQFLVFVLNENEFALPIDAVDEVARVPTQITRLPKTPKFLEGVVNLRGDVLPVVDQRRRFDMPPRDSRVESRLVVVRTERHRAGLIVDGVTDVLRCKSQSIGPAPDLTGDALGLVKSVINLEASGRIVLLLDPAELLSRTERGLLDSFGKESRSRGPRSS